MAELNALIGVDFSIVGTSLKAVYEKKDKGYAVLLIPSEQEADEGVSIGEVIGDIERLVTKNGGSVDTKAMEKELTGALSTLDDQTDTEGASGQGLLDKLKVRLTMAYLYLHKDGEGKPAETEYAFELQIITKGMIPDAIAEIVDVNDVSISIWNTTRKKVIDKMQLVSVSSYLELPEA